MSRKGGDFERELAKKLSLWWSHGNNDLVFWRSQTSGARATSRAKKGLRTEGHESDLTAVCPTGVPFFKAFAPEIKRGYGNESIVNVIDPTNRVDKRTNLPKKPTYVAWFEQAEAAMKTSGAMSWLIIHRRDFRQQMVFLPASTLKRLAHLSGIGLNTIELVFKPRGCITGLLLDDFLASVKPSAVINWVKKEWKAR